MQKLGKRKCKSCGIKFQKTQPLQMVCSPKCAIAYNRDLKWKKKRKVLKEKSKTLADWKNELQRHINWIVKKIDKDYPCISHPEMKNFLRYDAGHYFSVKAHSDLRYNLHNIHKQNSEANALYGGCPEYANGLIQRYGQDYFDMVRRLFLDYQGIGKEKFKIPQIRDVYLPNTRKIVIRIKAGETFTRDQVNEMIGIYDR